MSTTDPKIIEQNFEKSKSELKASLDSQLNSLNSMGMNIKEKSLINLTYPKIPVGARMAEQITASTSWWGVDIVMNEKMTQDIITGVATTGTIGGAIASALGGLAVITGPIAAVIGAGIAAVVAIKIAQIKITDNGKGVHWPITWLQWAALIAAVPLGPPGILAAGTVFLHPIRN